MPSLLIRFFLPFLRTRIPIESTKNAPLCIEEGSIWGRRVVSSEAFQSGTYPEGMWKKTFRNVALERLRPDSILVLGSGAGSILWIVQNIARKKFLNFDSTAIEWDPVMTRIGRVLYGDDFSKKLFSLKNFLEEFNKKENLSEYACGTIRVLARDAFEYVQESHEPFDLIVIDLFEGFSISESAFTKEFAESVYSRLSKKGTIVLNAFASADILEEVWSRAGWTSTRVQYQKNTVLIFSQRVV